MDDSQAASPGTSCYIKFQNKFASDLRNLAMHLLLVKYLLVNFS